MRRRTSAPPMKLIVSHQYSYFLVYHVWAKQNSIFVWSHREEDGVGIGQASYYKGKLKTIAAFNPLVVGLTCQGHYEWSARGTYPDHWTQKDEWQKCVPIEGDIEWWCLHSSGNIPLGVKYLPLSGAKVVTPDTSVLVLEGKITANDQGAALSAHDMHHIKPRPYPIAIEGDAKVWLISRMEPWTMHDSHGKN
jgi:hypothetical protein